MVAVVNAVVVEVADVAVAAGQTSKVADVAAADDEQALEVAAVRYVAPVKHRSYYVSVVVAAVDAAGVVVAAASDVVPVHIVGE